MLSREVVVAVVLGPDSDGGVDGGGRRSVDGGGSCPWQIGIAGWWQ